MQISRLLLAAIVLLGLAATGHAQTREVNVFNWSDYIDPKAIERFQAETGIHVRYDVYDSLETLEGKMLAGHSGYDVVAPTSEPTFSRLIRAGALQPLDRAKLPNLANLDPALMARVASSDPGNKFGAIYLWGTTGLGMDVAKVSKLVPGAPLDSWDLLFKPENARRIAPCGITMLDSATDVIPSVLHYLGHDPDSTAAADLADAERALLAIRPVIRAFASGGAIEQLASGETCLALDYSGDVIQAAVRAKEAAKGVAVKYVLPKEGAQIAFDMLAIPKDAPHPAEALAFINFMLQPDVMAGVTNTVRYANAVPASHSGIAREITEDVGTYPTPDLMARTFTVRAVSPDATRTRSRMWARFKSGG